MGIIGLPRRIKRRLRDTLRNLLGLADQRPRYDTWLDQHIRTRSAGLAHLAANCRFSILSTIWAGSDAQLLRATADSVRAQTYRNLEWVILGKGNLSAELSAVLADLAAEPRVRMLRIDRDLGIIEGMRHCLEQAQGDYVLPLDGDDVITVDALAVLAQAIAAAGEPACVYSDEDQLYDDRPVHPYFRPDWDPVLNASGSYIWHVCAFHRKTALSLDVFGDGAADWCHDWDTIWRFHMAGYEPWHVGEVLYHWRRHQQSSTNRRQPEIGSLESQRFVLERAIAQGPTPQRFELLPFPIDRGAPEWWIRRKPIEAPQMDLVLIRNAPESDVPWAIGGIETFPFDHIIRCGMVLGDESTDAPAAAARRALGVPEVGVEGLVAALLLSVAQRVAVMSADVAPLYEEWPWEALGLMERHPDTVLVSGRVADSDDTIRDAPGVFGPEAELHLLGLGGSAYDPGPYALRLKPSTVSTVCPWIFVADADFLRAHSGLLASATSLSALRYWLGALAARDGRRVVASPLLTGRKAGLCSTEGMVLSVGERERLAGLVGLPSAANWSEVAMLREARSYRQ